MTSRFLHGLVSFVAGLAAVPVIAAEVQFGDPIGDDHGPGSYTYPTDAAYAPRSFDLTGFNVKEKGGNLDFEVEVAGKLSDPWRMGVGFAVQMVFIFIDTDAREGSGNVEGLPGLNIQFAPGSAWEKVVVLSPQPQSRVVSEARIKAAALVESGDIVVPRRTTGKGKTISGRVNKADIGDGDITNWGYQVVMQSNEGFPDKSDLLTRKVNEYEGQHRFGGGNDGDCDPHVVDVLAGAADGAADEVSAQHAMLAYECGPDGESVKSATLTMVRK